MDDFLDQMVSSSPFNIEWAGMSRLFCDFVGENEAMNAMEAIPCASMETPIEDIGQLLLQNQSEEFSGILRDFPSTANYLSQVPISLCPPYLSQPVPIKEGDGSIKEETFGFQQQIFGIPSDISKKRTLEDEDPIMTPQEILFNSSGYAQARDVAALTGKMNQNYDKYVNFEDFKDQSGVAQHQSNSVVTEAKPRIRARRGQATEPHSIQERLRRKRIAAKMKALQELVPCSNKTDKASMLEECIDYMKLLQLQLKIASMSRLGGASAVAPIISIPSEGEDWCHNSMDVAVHKVARLMEEDMESARKFLESKGICLMPISMAKSIQGSLQGSSMDGSVVNASPPI